jgi:IrrE N-terminal-like domain
MTTDSGISLSEQAADDALRRARLSPAPPINVEALAFALGVHQIKTTKLVEDGRLESGDVVTIYVRRSVRPSRRRFTIAHEIGHLVLNATRPPPVLERTQQRAQSTTWEERFCDSFASAILMPRSWIIENFRHAPSNLFTIRQVADEAKVSLGAAVIRMHELLGWSKFLLRWRRRSESWRLVERAGVPRFARNGLRTAPQTNRRLTEISVASDDVRCEIPMLLDNRLVWVPSQVSIWGPTAVALADPHGLTQTMDR